MAINYEDDRFKTVEQERQTALNNVNNMYNNMISNNDKYYQDMANAAENYGNQQAEIQQANTDFTIEQINQQKEQAQKDYTREQKGAYADWQKQSNQYGVNAEQLASAGLSKTGYSESSQVSMYNTYQNRVSQARDTYNRAILDYDNGIKEAQLTNNAALAEIAYNTLQTKLELGLNSFNSKNQLLQQQLAAQNDVTDRYYSQWQDVLKQINNERDFAEEQRQFNEKLNEEKRQFNANYSLKSGNGNNKKVDKNAKLSKGAENLYNIIKTARGVSNKVQKTTKIGTNKWTDEKVSDYLANAYYNGQISDYELQVIAARLGM